MNMIFDWIDWNGAAHRPEGMEPHALCVVRLRNGETAHTIRLASEWSWEWADPDNDDYEDDEGPDDGQDIVAYARIDNDPRFCFYVPGNANGRFPRVFTNYSEARHFAQTHRRFVTPCVLSIDGENFPGAPQGDSDAARSMD